MAKKLKYTLNIIPITFTMKNEMKYENKENL